MSVPKRKHSKRRSGKRKQTKISPLPTTIICKSCGKMKRSHFLCPNCGK